QRQESRGLMVGVRVDRPMGEDNVRFLRGQKVQQRLCPLSVYLGSPINLTGKDCFRSEDFTCGLALGGADGGRLFMRLTPDAGLTAREIESGHVMPGRGIAGKRSTAAGLRIVGMGADADDS